MGWFWGFNIQVTEDVAFTVEQVNVVSIGDNGVEYPMSYTPEQCINAWDTATLTKNMPQSWSGGFPLQDVSDVRLELIGVDENGHELTFTGALTLSKEIAE